MSNLAILLIFLIILILIGYFFVLPRLPALLMVLDSGSYGNLPGIKPWEVTDIGFSVEDISLKGINGDIILTIENPNPYSTQIDRLTYKFYDEDGDLMANGATSSSYSIPAESSSQVVANVDVGWSGAASGIEDKITNFLSGDETIWSVQVEIKVGVGSASLGIPYKTTFNA